MTQRVRRPSPSIPRLVCVFIGRRVLSFRDQLRTYGLCGVIFNSWTHAQQQQERKEPERADRTKHDCTWRTWWISNLQGCALYILTGSDILWMSWTHLLAQQEKKNAGREPETTCIFANWIGAFIHDHTGVGNTRIAEVYCDIGTYRTTFHYSAEQKSTTWPKQA